MVFNVDNELRELTLVGNYINLSRETAVKFLSKEMTLEQASGVMFALSGFGIDDNITLESGNDDKDSFFDKIIAFLKKMYNLAKNIFVQIINKVKALFGFNKKAVTDYTTAKDKYIKEKENIKKDLAKYKGRSNDEIVASIKDQNKELAVFSKSLGKVLKDIKVMDKTIEEENKILDTALSDMEKLLKTLGLKETDPTTNNLGLGKRYADHITDSLHLFTLGGTSFTDIISNLSLYLKGMENISVLSKFNPNISGKSVSEITEGNLISFGYYVYELKYNQFFNKLDPYLVSKQILEKDERTVTIVTPKEGGIKVINMKTGKPKVVGITVPNTIKKESIIVDDASFEKLLEVIYKFDENKCLKALSDSFDTVNKTCIKITEDLKKMHAGESESLSSLEKDINQSSQICTHVMEDSVKSIGMFFGSLIKVVNFQRVMMDKVFEF